MRPGPAFCRVDPVSIRLVVVTTMHILAALSHAARGVSSHASPGSTPTTQLGSFSMAVLFWRHSWFDSPIHGRALFLLSIEDVNASASRRGREMIVAHQTAEKLGFRVGRGCLAVASIIPGLNVM
jgi:hypothetical protein